MVKKVLVSLVGVVVIATLVIVGCSKQEKDTATVTEDVTNEEEKEEEIEVVEEVEDVKEVEKPTVTTPKEEPKPQTKPQSEPQAKPQVTVEPTEPTEPTESEKVEEEVEEVEKEDVEEEVESESSESTESTESSGTVMKFKVTAYCNCSKCCGKWAGGATASGVMPTAGRTVAMGGVPFGTKIILNGNTYVVEDRGTPYGHVDIYFNSHQEALNFGLQYLTGEVIY